MRRWIILLTFSLLSVSLDLSTIAQNTCSTFNTSTDTPVTADNAAQHTTGNHSFAVTAVQTCTYTHGATTNCNTQCSVTGTPVPNEGGNLVAGAGPHKVAAGSNPGNASATNGGTQCTGYFGAAAVDCTGNPNCSLSVTVSSGGVAPLASNGTVIWNSGALSVANNCAAVKDPQNSSTGGGVSGCQPDCPANSPSCIPCGASPIILDVDGNGYQLTDAVNGVRFDISGTGNPIQMGWTAAGSTNAFLALPGPDGLVHNGQQLFGNFTPQPPSDQPNGFAALAVYDDPSHGGNGDGIIDAHDAIFALLRLWIDANHDGISQPEELHTLPSLGVNSISLNYKWDDKTDEFGNVFRYRARLNPVSKTDVGKTAYDVFFVVQTDRKITRNNKCIVPGGMPQLTSSLDLE